MKENSAFAENFPQDHPNHIQETKSINALRSALPPEKFNVRDERYPDYGIDLSIEVKDNGHVKNFRASVQIKSSSSAVLNGDGSYSLPVSTSNLNYLLNNPLSIYFFYIEPNDELRFAWAWDECVRIEETNPDWIEQKSVTLRFFSILNEITTEEIRQRILTQGASQRIISKNVYFANSKDVVFEIDSETFHVNDLKELHEIITSRGIGLCISGKADWVLEKIRLFTEEERKNTKIRVIEAVAQFEKGRYQRAKENIAVLRNENKDISKEDLVITDFIKLHCDRETGKIDYSALVEGLRKLADEKVERLPYNIRCSYLQLAVCNINDEEKRFSGENEKKRRELFQQLKDEIESNADTKEENELDRRNQFALLKLEGSLIALEFGTEVGRCLMNMPSSMSNLQNVIASQNATINEWEAKMNVLSSRSAKPLMFADIICEKASVFFLLHSTNLLLSKYVALDDIFGPNVFEQFHAPLETAIKIYDQNQMIPQKLKAQIWLAGIHFIARRITEFQQIQATVIRTAADFNLSGLSEEAHKPIYQQGQEAINREEDSDERQASLDDRTIEIYAQQRIDAFHLPQERLDNVRLSLEFLRDRAIEHLEWCEHLNLLEDERQAFYRINPNRIAACNKHPYVSNIGRPDWKVVASEFKTKYCASCPDRSPKVTDIKA